MQDISIMLGGYKFNFRVCALIENNSRYLLEESKVTDFLNLPGGRVHAGESTLSAIKRELKEELGLCDVNPRLIKVTEQFFKFADKKYHELNFVYYINLSNEHELCQKNHFANLDNQDETMVWVNIKDLHNYKILPEFIYTIKDDKKITQLIYDKINNQEPIGI